MGSTPPPPQKGSLLIRLMSALLGLSLGFIAGQMFASPFKSVKKEAPAGSAGILALPPAGAPLHERVSAVARMDEDALAGVLAAAQDEWLRSGASPDTAPHSMLLLRMIFSRWTDLNSISALRAALDLQDHTFGDMALEAVMTEWGLRDSLSASQSLSLIPRLSSQKRASLALVRAGVKRSPAEGLDRATRTPFVTQTVLRGAAGAEWMRRDAVHALRYLFEEPGLAGAVPSGLALGQWLLEDPAAFVKWYKTDKNAKFIPMVRLPPQWMTPGRFARVFAVFTREYENADAGLKQLLALGSTYALPVLVNVTPAAEALNAEMAFWLSQRNGFSPHGVPGGWLPRARHSRMLADILPRLGAADPAAALQALAGMPPEDEAARLAPAVAAQWIEQAPATAAAKIFSGDLNNPVAKAAASTAVNQLISSDPLRALDHLSKLPLAAADIAAYRAASLQHLSASRPADMLDWLAKNPDITAPADALTTAIQSLASGDPLKAQEWVQRSAPPADRPALTGLIFDVQLRNDRDAALAFLTSQPAGATRDAILASLASADTALSRRDANFAGNLLPDTFALALQISADAPRVETLRSLLAAMKDTGVSSASSLANPALRPADRALLTR